jgi:hypothetical protein
MQMSRGPLVCAPPLTTPGPDTTPGPERPPAGGSLRLKELICVTSGFTAVTLVFMAPLMRELKTSLPAWGDPILNAWILAWGADRLPHGLRGFWSPPIFYPYENTLAYSENLLGIAVLVAPVQWIFGNPTLTYNIAFLLSYIVTAVGGYVLARELTGRRDAAVVAGCAFGFAPYRWAQITHLQVLFVGWMPLALWALHRALRSPSWPMFAVLTAAVLLQVFSNAYSAYHLALAIGVVAIWCGARDAHARRTLWRVAAAGVLVGLLLSPALMAYYQVWVGRHPIGGYFSADVGSYLQVAPGLPHAGWLPGTAEEEGRLFPGLVVLALAAIAVAPLGRRWPASPWRWLYGLLAVLAILLSLGPEPTAWGRRIPIPDIYSWLLSTVPLLDALRVPARFGIVAVLAFALLASLGAARVLGRAGRWRAAAAVGAFCAVILWEGHGSPLGMRPHVFPERSDVAAYDWLARQPRGVLLNLPISTLGRGSLEPQFAALVHGHPTVNGISRIETPLQTFLGGSASPLSNPALLPEAVPFLRALGIRYVLIRPDLFFDAGVAERLSGTLARFEGTRLAVRFRDFAIYEIEPDEGGSAPAVGAGTDRLVKVPPTTFRLSASHQPDRLPMAVDEDPDTRWMSGRPQDGTEWVALEFDRPREVARVDLVMSPRSVRDYPRDLEILAGGSAPDEAERTLHRGPILENLGSGWRQSPELPVASIDLPPYPTTRLVLRQLGQAAPWYWSIDELMVWEHP